MKLISVLIVCTILLGCTSTSKRDVASQEKNPENSALLEEAKENYERLKEKSKSVVSVEKALKAQEGIQKTKEIGNSVWNSRMRRLMSYTITKHSVDALEGAVASVTGNNLSKENKAAMISLPLAVLIPLKLRPHLLDTFPFLSNRKVLRTTSGSLAVVNRNFFSRVPRAILRTGILAAGYVASEAAINALVKQFIPLTVEEAEALTNHLKQDLEKDREELGIEETPSPHLPSHAPTTSLSSAPATNPSYTCTTDTSIYSKSINNEFSFESNIRHSFHFSNQKINQVFIDGRDSEFEECFDNVATIQDTSLHHDMLRHLERSQNTFKTRFVGLKSVICYSADEGIMFLLPNENEAISYIGYMGPYEYLLSLVACKPPSSQ